MNNISWCISRWDDHRLIIEQEASLQKDINNQVYWNNLPKDNKEIKMMLFMETKKQTAIMAIVRKKISFLEEVSRKLEKTMDSIEEELLIDKEE